MTNRALNILSEIRGITGYTFEFHVRIAKIVLSATVIRENVSVAALKSAGKQQQSSSHRFDHDE